MNWPTRRALALLAATTYLMILPSDEGVSQDQPPSATVDLALKQSQLADGYRRLETLMLQMAEYDASDNPRRAALLRQALSQSKDRHISLQMETLVRLFQQEKLQRALDNQSQVRDDLKVLLDLLLSEDRSDRLHSEQTRLRRYLKELDRIIRQQKGVQGRTEGGDDTPRLAQDQQQVADRTQELGQEIDETETPRETGDGQPDEGEVKGADTDDSRPPDSPEPAPGSPEPGPTEQDEGQPSQGPSGEGQPSERESSQGQPNQGRPDEGQPSEGQPSQGQPGEGQPGEGQPGEQGQPGQGNQEASPPQQDSYPGRKRIQAAEEKMRMARQRLDEAKRAEAITEQEQAQRLLEQAKAELEEILRQLREEEIERVLAMLEGRFRKMLEMQLKVYDGTVQLDKMPSTERTRQFSIQAGKLGLEQRRIVLEVDKALALLREEGSSAAFPEAVQQMRSDMDQIAGRLSEEEVGLRTQGLEEDVISALEEMIEALQKAQRDAEQRRMQPPPPTQGEPSDPPLVDQLAELKMIRALQMRVNNRTQRYAQLLEDMSDPVGQALDEDLIDSLRDLSQRQQRIHQVTSDIVVGRNE